MEDFVKAIQSTNIIKDMEDYVPKDIFAPVRNNEPALIERAVGEAQVPGQPKINLNFQSKRFFIGNELTHVDKDGKHYMPVDDSDDYKEKMDLIFSGKAMQLHCERKLMENGAMVIWLEWGEYIETHTPPASERNYFTEAELKSPERLKDKPHSGLKEPVVTAPVASPVEEEEAEDSEDRDEPSTDDEEPWE